MRILRAGGVSDHGALGGLGDDDHTIYTLADGTRPFSGAVAGVSPSTSSHLATKGYVDAAVNGLDVKASCRVATDSALPANTRTGNVLDADANGALTVDGVALSVGDRVLVKDEATGADNGIYEVTDAGSAGTPWQLTRASDADADAEVTAGLFTFITEGTANADTGWVLTTDDPITVNTTALSFTQFGPSTGGAAWESSGGNFQPKTSEIGAGDTMLHRARETDGATAVAHKFTNANGLATAGAKIAAFYSDDGTTEEAYIDKDGFGVFAAGQVEIGDWGGGSHYGVRRFSASMVSLQAGGSSLFLGSGGFVTPNSSGDLGVIFSNKLFVDGPTSAGAPSGAGDTYFTKSALTGGNFSYFFDGSEVMRDDGSAIRWSGRSVGVYGAIGDTNPTVQLDAETIQFGPGGASALDVGLARHSSGESLDVDDAAGGGAGFGLLEMATAPSGVANKGILFAEDNGAGKTRLMVQFPTGAAQQVAIEP